MIRDDEYLERIVAGIQSITTTGSGAEVSWNENIEGRQFDVVVRFKLGTMRFVVLIEVKNRARRTEAKDIEAFVTKAGDKKSNKTIVVTTAGFQEGAIEVARRHNIDLFMLTFDDSKVDYPKSMGVFNLETKRREQFSPEFSFGEKELATVISCAVLVYLDGSRHELPSEQSQMYYYALRTKLSDGRSLKDLIESNSLPAPRLDEKLNHVVEILPHLQIDPPDKYFLSSGTLASVELTLEGKYARKVHGDAQIDPSIFTSPVVYTNALTGESLTFPIYLIPLGFKRVKQAQFYFAEHPLRYLYCDSVRSNIVTWKMIESFQAGHFVRATYEENIKYSHLYIPVTDRMTLKRLKARLKEYESPPR